MSSPSKCQKKSCTNDGLDIISDLPLELKQQILTHLPIQESVRTSVLSSRWRRAWTSVSQLLLDQQSLFKGESDNTSEQFIKIVDKVFSQHKLPISVFDLFATEFCKEALDRWIYELLKHPIEKFCIQSLGGPNYNISSELYMLHKLKELRLINCTINLPNVFKGFKGLKSLSLRYCTLKEDELKKFVSNCPNLEILNLCALSNMIYVNINSQKLQKFRIIGYFKKIHLITPFLIETCILSNPVKNKLPNVDPFDRLDQAFNRAKLRFKVFDNPEKALPERLNNLKSMYMMIDFGDKDKSALALSLLKDAPNLQILLLYVIGEVNPESNAFMVKFWESAKVSFEHLKFLKLYYGNGLLCSEPLLAFMKVLLGCTFKLEIELSSSINDPIEKFQFANKLRTFKRASGKCDVGKKGHDRVFDNPEKALPERLNNLKSMYIMIDFGDKDKSALALSLLKDAPNLQILLLYVSGEVNPESNAFMVKFWESAKVSFEHLKFLKLHYRNGLLCSEPLLAFMKVLLGCTFMLEIELYSSINDPIEKFQFAKKLRTFKRASGKCDVGKKGHDRVSSICSQVVQI